MSGNWTSPTPKGSSGASQLAKPPGPPYAPTMAIVGGVPSPAIDDPVAAVLLLLFLLSAAAHMAILRINKQRHLKFVFSGMLFALCLLRGVSLVARIIWASYPATVDAVIAASVMTQCGSVLIFIINLFFAHRVLRAYHPRLGWHRGARYAVWFLIACVLCCLVMAIAATIHGFFTLSRPARRADRAVQLFAGAYLACLAFLPVPVVCLAVAARPRSGSGGFRVEKFGAGRWRAKVGLLVFTSLVATLGAGFRVGASFDGRPAAHPAWFHSRACYYCFNFVTDLVVSTAYLLARFDRRFIVPDGARGPGDYSPLAPAVPPPPPSSSSAANSRTDLVGKLPLMGSEKPLAMMRQGSFSGHTIVAPFKPFTPTSSPPRSRLASPTRGNGNGNGNATTTNASTCCYNTDASNTAARNSPATSGSFSRGKLPPQHDYHNYLTYHHHDPQLLRTQPQPQPPSSSAVGRTSRLVGRSGRDVIRSVRMRINSEADAYGPDGSSSSHDSAGGRDATDTDPLVASSTIAPSTTTTTTTVTASRPRHRNHHHHHNFLRRSRGGGGGGGGGGEMSGSGSGSRSGNPSVRTPAPAHLGPPILPDLDLDLELLSATLLAPWALDGWGFSSSPGRRASSRRSTGSDGGAGLLMMSGGGGSGSGGRRGGGGGGGGGGEESNRSSSESRDTAGGDSERSRSQSRSRSGQSSCTYTGRARTM
ncbi:hypothetical protein F4818DRAFT_455773 [Hypoxylon cercidicola]|nr:hypothetical protein F4818DRAFT_455773 [Hypoxylon cercidicola]